MIILITVAYLILLAIVVWVLVHRTHRPVVIAPRLDPLVQLSSEMVEQAKRDLEAPHKQARKL